MSGDLKEFLSWSESQRRVNKAGWIRFPEERRRWAATYARRRMEAGATFREVLRLLAISEPTLRRWMAASETETTDSTRVLAPVVIADIQRAQRPALAVMTRGGLRIEGLDIESTVELVRRLES